MILWSMILPNWDLANVSRLVVHKIVSVLFLQFFYYIKQIDV